MDLVTVDDAVLERLVHAATGGASADEVTPPLTPGNVWTPSRASWLYDFHRARRVGIDGPAGETTWAVVFDEQVVGSLRLKRTDVPNVLETGVWLVRCARGRGIGRRAVAAVIHKAAELGASAVVAETTEANAVARRVLSGLGFSIDPTDPYGRIRALLRLAEQNQ
jgi:RimJ/RimL family protein N-acetyltransferase